MKKIIFFGLFIITLFSSCNKKGEIGQSMSITSTKTNEIVFAITSTSIGIIVDGKVKFFDITQSGWKEDVNWEFTMP